MGVTITDNDDQVATGEMSATKPKERQFQVVPVPGTFTRGRWKCWDYKEKSANSGEEIIDFSEKNDKMTAATVTISKATLSANIAQTLNHTVSEPRLLPTAKENTGLAATHPIDVPVVRNESTTILVTSIAPASVTPVQGTPSSTYISPLNENITADSSQNILPVEVIKGANTSPTVTTASVSPIVNPSSTSRTNVASLLSSGQILQGSNTESAQQVAQQDVQNETARLTSIVAPSGQVLNVNTDSDDSAAAASSTTSGPNVVPIDNKIEQAMDLVKTHLTFAVREEVEILRSTIVDLEAKVAQLESQNQILKQFAPADVISQLAILVQQHQQKLQQQQTGIQCTASSQASQVTMPTVTSSANPLLTSAAPHVEACTEPDIVDESDEQNVAHQ